MKIISITIVIFFCVPVVFGQQSKPSKYAGIEKLKTFNRTVSIEKENGSIIVKVNEADGPGIAWISGEQFTEGDIEVDIKGRSLFQQSFVGIAFHGVNDTTYEAVYFRPFNFNAADAARKLHAVQYMAVPQFDWPKLRADFPNQYEKPVSPAPDPDKWFHVRLQVREDMINVFVNGNAMPSLAVKPLVKLSGKLIGYWAGNGSDGSWKNLKITSLKKKP